MTLSVEAVPFWSEWYSGRTRVPWKSPKDLLHRMACRVVSRESQKRITRTLQLLWECVWSRWRKEAVLISRIPTSPLVHCSGGRSSAEGGGYSCLVEGFGFRQTWQSFKIKIVWTFYAKLGSSSVVVGCIAFFEPWGALAWCLHAVSALCSSYTLWVLLLVDELLCLCC